MKNLYKYLVIMICFCMIVPYSTNAYEFESESRENAVKRTRREIYDLYAVYKELAGSSTGFNVNQLNYNGTCSMVQVDTDSVKATVPLEDYVAGVVKAEVGAESDKPELYKTQAIVARSFIIYRNRKDATCRHKGQAYREINPNNKDDQLIIQAVQETAGMVVTRNGEVANADYISFPNENYWVDDATGWHVQLQRFEDDDSTAWTWNGPSKQEVINANNYEDQPVSMKVDYHYGMSQTIAGYLAGKKGYTYEQLIKLFYDQPISLLSDGNYDDNIKYLDSSFGRITYFNQGDYKKYYYSDNPTSSNPYGATIASHGCGPTSAAIVASSILNQTISPVTMTQKVCLRGGCSSGGTENRYLGETLSGDFGLHVTMTNNDQEVINALGTGNALVIVLMGPGTFTSGGHYIVLTGVNSKGQVSVADPASRTRTNKSWFSFNTIIEQRKTARYTIVTR